MMCHGRGLSQLRCVPQGSRSALAAAQNRSNAFIREGKLFMRMGGRLPVASRDMLSRVFPGFEQSMPRVGVRLKTCDSETRQQEPQLHRRCFNDQQKN